MWGEEGTEPLGNIWGRRRERLHIPTKWGGAGTEGSLPRETTGGSRFRVLANGVEGVGVGGAEGF